jgi:hypothetical protein
MVSAARFPKPGEERVIVIDDEELERLNIAGADGRLSGLERSNRASDCPFNHDQPTLRLAWFDGFGAGRIEAAMNRPPV